MNPLIDEIELIADFKKKVKDGQFSQEEVIEFIEKMEDMIIQVEMTNQINSRLQHTLLRANRKIKQLSELA